MPGTQGQLFQEHTVSKQMDIVPGNSFRLFPNEGCGHARFRYSGLRPLFCDRSLSSSQIISENAGPHGLCVPSGPPSYSWASPSALADTEDSIRRLESRTLANQGELGLWSKEEESLHINCLEMLAVCQALHVFLPDLKGHHVSISMVAYINHQGRLSLRRLFTLVEHLLEWARHNLRSLRATHVPGKVNQGADMLSRSNVSSEEWTLHPQVV